MLFNLNEFLMSVSFALDFVEMDVLGVPSNHGKRVAYIALKVGQHLGLSSKELHDIVSLAILHDNGVSEKNLYNNLMCKEEINLNEVEVAKKHCIIGEENIINYPFLTDVKNIIKYHHEKYDGSGFFKLKGDEIPIMAQIIQFANDMEMNNNFKSDKKEDIISFIKERENISFSHKISRAFIEIARDEKFWININNESINNIIKKETPSYSLELSFDEIRNITKVLSKIIDCKSRYTQRHSRGLSEKVGIMADFYNYSHDEKVQLMIAADLHDIGKLAVPNSILDSPNKLTEEEFKVVKNHAYYTRVALHEIKGFEKITEWAANHHEKLNGKGYPFGFTEDNLDFNSRLMACLDIYQAITEERPYRKSLSHKEAMGILNKMSTEGYIDSKITNDINEVFSL
ncbi:HD-GYP domain-containing protein [Clostridium senegalense]|uniref:HD-GYP domain-containing protein n=1 Tax=Clostridium senegalense TaxID=1465809 RepID=UPI001C11DBCC|nr:HD domain-containing phosphohydrolase [Clostridium senegalense]MBU5226786.1 HD domain-containing protein [Clostridium senegalense]